MERLTFVTAVAMSENGTAAGSCLMGEEALIGEENTTVEGAKKVARERAEEMYEQCIGTICSIRHIQFIILHTPTFKPTISTAEATIPATEAAPLVEVVIK